MPYTTLPTFADGDVLTAADLNLLADNIEFLFGLVSGVNVPFSSDSIAGSSGVLTSSRPYAVRYQARYLLYKIRVVGGETEQFEIIINEVQEVVDTVDRTAPYTFEGYIDLEGITTPPTLLDWLSVRVAIDWNVGGSAVLDYLLQSDETTI